MKTNDGRHYGANVKLDGAGKYEILPEILLPPYIGFFRHTDKETGTAAWCKPFTVTWTFVWAGNGKLGGY